MTSNSVLSIRHNKSKSGLNEVRASVWLRPGGGARHLATLGLEQHEVAEGRESVRLKDPPQQFARNLPLVVDGVVKIHHLRERIGVDGSVAGDVARHAADLVGILARVYAAAQLESLLVKSTAREWDIMSRLFKGIDHEP